MNIQINHSEKGYYISVNNERITDFTKFKPNKGAVIKIKCPISSLKADLETLFLQDLFSFVDSPYLSDTFIVEDNTDYFLLAILNKNINEVNNESK